MTTNIKIVPGWGLRWNGGSPTALAAESGDLRLGMTRVDVQRCIGDPSHREREEYADDSVDEVWSYEDIDLSLTFSTDEGDLLGSISTGNSDACLASVDGSVSVQPIGLDEEELLQILEEVGVETLELDEDLAEEISEHDAKYYRWQEQNVGFWLTYGFLTSITAMVMFDSDERPVWPDESS